MQLVFDQIRSGGDRNFGYLLGDRTAREAVRFSLGRGNSDEEGGTNPIAAIFMAIVKGA